VLLVEERVYSMEQEGEDREYVGEHFAALRAFVAEAAAAGEGFGIIPMSSYGEGWDHTDEDRRLDASRVLISIDGDERELAARGSFEVRCTQSLRHSGSRS
jgi:hypothetical protein